MTVLIWWHILFVLIVICEIRNNDKFLWLSFGVDEVVQCGDKFDFVAIYQEIAKLLSVIFAFIPTTNQSTSIICTVYTCDNEHIVL